MPLPSGVQIARARGKTYFYWFPNRNTSHQGKRIKLYGDPFAPAGSPENERFWRELNALAKPKIETKAGSIGDIVARYRTSKEFMGLAVSTQRTYNVHLNRMADSETWGELGARELTPMAVMAARDALAEYTPGMANQMLSIGRILYDWAIPLDLTDHNPFDKVKPLVMEDRGHVPWPDFIVAFVKDNTPDDLNRMVRLGIATCQRESDLIRMGPDHREGNGIWCRPKKTKKKRKSFRIPLAAADLLMLDRWTEEPMTFTAKRFKQPLTRHRADLYLYTPRGKPYTDTALRARWNRWLAQPKGKELCAMWTEWLRRMIARYEWDINPEDMTAPTIHGLRGTGLLARFSLGYTKDRIANDVGMHPRTVDHYMRFRDQVEVGEAGLRLVSVNKDV